MLPGEHSSPIATLDEISAQNFCNTTAPAADQPMEGSHAVDSMPIDLESGRSAANVS